jgi:hypothetical protein
MGTALDNPHERSATTRAEELLDRVGQRLMAFTVVTRQRIQGTITSVRTEAERMDQLKEEKEQQPATKVPVQPSPPSQESAPSAPTKAGEIVDTWGQRMGAFAILTNLQWRRTTARLREGVEDMWAEAQDIRGRAMPHENAANPPQQ